MMVSRDNYEIFIIDYLDGNLKPLEVAELMLFLERNPDLKEELNIIKKDSYLTSFKTNFPNKNTLKVIEGVISKSNVQEYLIRELEQDLNHKEHEKLEAFIKANPKYDRHRVSLLSTKLSADTSITYPDKESLKRKQGKVIPLYIKISSVAAALLFLLMLQLDDNKKTLTRNVPSSNKVNKSIEKNETALPLSEAKLIAGTSDKKVKPLVPIVNTNVKTDEAASMTENDSTAFLAKRTIEEPLAISAEEESKLNELVAPVTALAKADSSHMDEYIPTLKELLLQKVAGREAASIEKETPAINKWSIAKLAVKVFNKVTGKEVQLQKEIRDDVVVYAIKSEKFQFSKKYSRESLEN